MPLLMTECNQFLATHGITAVYLFGSRAAGLEHASSDYDLAFLFAEYHPSEHDLSLRLTLAEELSQRLGERVDLVFLQGASILMRFEVVATGKVVYCTNDAFRTDFEDIAYRDYLDFKPFMDQYYRDEAEAVKSGHFFKS